MEAIYVAKGEVRHVLDYEKPKAGPGEALIRVMLAGICATDLEIVKGYAGFEGILGHEFVGEVVHTADEADGDWIGRRVVGEINLGCRRCAVCLGQGPEHCPNRSVLGIARRNGVFAQFTTLPVANLHVVPDDLPDETAVFTEPLAAALRIREQLPIRPTVEAAVVGPGRMGMLIGQVLALGGSHVTMLGRSPNSLELPAQLGLPTALVDEVHHDSFDFVVEATGNESGLVQSLRMVRPLGTLVLKSTFAGTATIDLTKLVVGEINVVGSRCGPFAPALRILQRGSVQVQPLIDNEYPLAQAKEALEHAARPNVRKVLLRL